MILIRSPASASVPDQSTLLTSCFISSGRCSEIHNALSLSLSSLSCSWIKIKCYLSKGLCNNGISPELRERKKLFSFYGKERRLSRSNQSRYKAENDKNSNCSWVDGCKGDRRVQASNRARQVYGVPAWTEQWLKGNVVIFARLTTTVYGLHRIHHHFLNSRSMKKGKSEGHNTTKARKLCWDESACKARPGSILDNKNTDVQFQTLRKSLGRWATVLPRVEFDRSDVCIVVGHTWAVNGSAVLGVFSIVFIHFQLAPGCRGDFIGPVKPSWSKLLPLGLSCSFLSSLLLFKPESFHEMKCQDNWMVATCLKLNT